MPKIKEVKIVNDTETQLTKSEIQNKLDVVDSNFAKTAQNLTDALSSLSSSYSCKFKRTQVGLINNLEYEYDNLGFINYKKLISKEFLVPNKQYFKSRNLPLPDSGEGLPDNQLICLLNGYKTLAAIRGFKSVKHKIVSSSYESVTIQTTITWVPNYETDFQEVKYTALATASLNNTYSFAKNYLAEIAQNRGECRAIRGFLRIPIVAQDELGPQAGEEDSQPETKNTAAAGPYATLKKKMDERNISWEKLKATSEKKYEGASAWNSIGDIPAEIVVDILTKMSEKVTQKV